MRIKENQAGLRLSIPTQFEKSAFPARTLLLGGDERSTTIFDRTFASGAMTGGRDWVQARNALLELPKALLGAGKVDIPVFSAKGERASIQLAKKMLSENPMIRYSGPEQTELLSAISSAAADFRSSGEGAYTQVFHISAARGLVRLGDDGKPLLVSENELAKQLRSPEPEVGLQEKVIPMINDQTIGREAVQELFGDTSNAAMASALERKSFQNPVHVLSLIENMAVREPSAEWIEQWERGDQPPPHRIVLVLEGFGQRFEGNSAEAQSLRQWLVDVERDLNARLQGELQIPPGALRVAGFKNETQVSIIFSDRQPAPGLEGLADSVEVPLPNQNRREALFLHTLAQHAKADQLGAFEPTQIERTFFEVLPYLSAQTIDAGTEEGLTLEQMVQRQKELDQALPVAPEPPQVPHALQDVPFAELEVRGLQSWKEALEGPNMLMESFQTAMDNGLTVAQVKAMLPEGMSVAQVARELSGLSVDQISRTVKEALVEALFDGEEAVEPKDAKLPVNDVIRPARLEHIRESLGLNQVEILYPDRMENLPDPIGVEFLAERLSAAGRVLKYGDLVDGRGIEGMPLVLVAGAPGTGKSLLIKKLGTETKLPVLQVTGNLLDRYVGSSEERFDRLLQLCEAMQPCILYFDEMEKFFAGSANGQANDSGVMQRISQRFLTWLQESQSKVLVAGAINFLGMISAPLARRADVYAVDYQPPEILSHTWKAVLDAKAPGHSITEQQCMELALDDPSYNGGDIDLVVRAALARSFDAALNQAIAENKSPESAAAAHQPGPNLDYDLLRGTVYATRSNFDAKTQDVLNMIAETSSLTHANGRGANEQFIPTPEVIAQARARFDWWRPLEREASTPAAVPTPDPGADVAVGARRGRGRAKV